MPKPFNPSPVWHLLAPHPSRERHNSPDVVARNRQRAESQKLSNDDSPRSTRVCEGNGIVLESGASAPSFAELIAGEPIQQWWGHRKASQIFAVRAFATRRTCWFVGYLEAR